MQLMFRLATLRLFSNIFFCKAAGIVLFAIALYLSSYIRNSGDFRRKFFEPVPVEFPELNKFFLISFYYIRKLTKSFKKKFKSPSSFQAERLSSWRQKTVKFFPEVKILIFQVYPENWGLDGWGSEPWRTEARPKVF